MISQMPSNNPMMNNVNASMHMQRTNGVNVDDPSLYKKCRKKLHDAYVCKPPIGTVVVNMLEQAITVKQLGGKTYFSVEDLQKTGAEMIKRLADAINNGLACRVTEQQPFVLAGTMGELRTISAQGLAREYSFIKEGNPIPINQETMNERSKNNMMDWTLVRSNADNTSAWACFVPYTQVGQLATSTGVVLYNDVRLKHGKGDFIIASDAGGRPNMSNRMVVNGFVFGETYNNQGWTDNLQANTVVEVTKDKLPKLVCAVGDARATQAMEYITNFISQLGNKPSTREFIETVKSNGNTAGKVAVARYLKAISEISSCASYDMKLNLVKISQLIAYPTKVGVDFVLSPALMFRLKVDVFGGNAKLVYLADGKEHAKSTPLAGETREMAGQTIQQDEYKLFYEGLRRLLSELGLMKLGNSYYMGDTLYSYLSKWGAESNFTSVYYQTAGTKEFRFRFAVATLTLEKLESVCPNVIQKITFDVKSTSAVITVDYLAGTYTDSVNIAVHADNDKFTIHDNWQKSSYRDDIILSDRFEASAKYLQEAFSRFTRRNSA